MQNTPRLIESHRIYTVNLAAHIPPKLRQKKGELGRGPVTLLRLVNMHSMSEKQGGGRPDYWEMVFWWTRKPLAGARFVIAASLLPENTDIAKLAKALGLLEDKTAHRVNPRPEELGEHAKYLREASLLDPFAGFGSIPLEAVRLGLREVVAVELLPTAYVFLKAVLEYPTRYARLTKKLSHSEAKQLEPLLDIQSLERKGLAKRHPDGTIEAPALIVDVARAGKQVTEKLANDPDIKDLYDQDTAVYIGTWEVRCPGTNTYTPLVGNWWLARVRTGNRYKRLAYMKPRIQGGRVEIEVVDLNRLHGDVSRARLDGNTIEIKGRKYTVPEPNITARSETATCLQTGQPLGYIDPETQRHYTTKQQAPPNVRNRLEWLPKWALKQWSKMLEDYLEGKITLEELRQAPARPRLLVKVKVAGNDIVFEPAIEEDQEKLWKALERLKQLWGDPDIPTEPIPEYENRRITPILGAKHWYQFFNPRQLLTLVKLVKHIRETAKEIMEEKLREGWNREEAHKYTEAITTYLAIAIARKALFNSVANTWNAGSWALIKIRGGGALSFRGIAMNWNWAEIHPMASPMYSWEECLITQIDGLSYLVAVFLETFSNVEILLDDAVVLGGLRGAVFSVVVTDPPYYDDVPYSELSDFYYVWLKRALSRVENGRLAPWFLGEAFFRRVGGRYREVRTQWEEVARREISVNLGRLGLSQKDMEKAVRWFEDRLGAALRAAASRVASGGLVVTYYNHTSVDAWASLLRAGWELAGLRVSAAVPLVTESGERVTARGKVRLDTSIVVVWRRDGFRDSCDEGEAVRVAVEEARGFVGRMVEAGVVGYDLLFAGLGRALSVLTSCRSLVSPRGRLSAREVAELGYSVAARAVAEALAGAAGVQVSSAPGRFYLITRVLFAEAGDIRLDGSTVGILQVGVGVSRDAMVAQRILGRPRRSGDPYPLLYPRSVDRAALRRLLEQRGLSPDPGRAVVRSSVDALHLLYYAVASGVLGEAVEALRARAPSHVEEALAIAKVLCRFLPDDDPEKTLACRVSGQTSGATIDAWLRRGK